MRWSPHRIAPLLLAGTLAMAVTAHAQGITDMKKGEGGSAVQGSAGPSAAPGAPPAPARRAGSRAMPAPAHAQGITDMKRGEGGSAVQGSAGPSAAPGAASDLER